MCAINKNQFFIYIIITFSKSVLVQVVILTVRVLNMCPSTIYILGLVPLAETIEICKYTKNHKKSLKTVAICVQAVHGYQIVHTK